MVDGKVAVTGEHELAGREVGDGVLAVGDPDGVNLGTVWNQIPRYHLGVPSEKLLPVWKKPSANRPLLDTSLSRPASSWLGERVSVAAAWHGGRVCKWRVMSRRSTKTAGDMAGCMVKEEGCGGLLLWCAWKWGCPYIEETLEPHLAFNDSIPTDTLDYTGRVSCTEHMEKKSTLAAFVVVQSIGANWRASGTQGSSVGTEWEGCRRLQVGSVQCMCVRVGLGQRLAPVVRWVLS